MKRRGRKTRRRKEKEVEKLMRRTKGRGEREEGAERRGGGETSFA